MTRLYAIAVFTVALVVACDRVPLTSPTGSTISLSIDKNVVPVNGQATVTAVVTESAGTAVHNGTTVTFQTSLGRIDPVEAQTVNGKAVATFIAGSTSGTAAIHAFSGGARTGSGNSSAGGVEVKVGTAAAERIAVRTEPLNIPVTGGTVTVVASLFDAGGNPIINTPLTFSSDFGALSANSATTDGNGDARVSLTTNRTTVITVTAGSKTQAFTLTALNPPTVTLNCGTANTATVGVPVSCTITPAVSGNGSSSAPIQNVTINWGDGTGETPLGALPGASVVSHTYSTAGSFQVTAAATDANSQRGSAVVTLNVTRAIPTISITGPSTGTVGVPVSFTVTPPASPTVPIASVVIDFGDGTSRNLGSVTAVQSVSKTYGSAGNFTVSATVTDTAGTRNTASTSIFVSPTSGPTLTFAQNGTLGASTVGSFTATATAASGATITSVVVRRGIANDGEVVYQGSTGGTFAVGGLSVNDVLTSTATDSLGATSRAQVVVK